MSSTQTETMSELYCIAETIENGMILVTASPEIWVDDNILLWPPGDVDRSVPTPPQSDWTPIMCKVLKRSIATFEEALNLEKMYSKHRNSDSFRQDQARKQLKRKHPVNENENLKSNLIDMNSFVTKINNMPESNYVEPKMKDSKYHSLCLQKNNTKLITAEPKKIKSDIPIRPPWSTVHLKSKNSQIEKGGAVNEVKKPRYNNYLKSGKINIASGKKKISPPPLMKLKKAEASSTITKEQFLRQNARTENGLDVSSTPIKEDLPSFDDQINTNNTIKVKPICSDVFHEETLDDGPKSLSDNYQHVQFDTGLFAKNVLKPSNKSVTGVNIIDDVVIKPARVMTTPTVFGNDQTNDNVVSAILSGLSDIKNFFKQSEEKRIKFEARMQTQWEIFVKKVMLNQGQNDGFGESLNDDGNDDFDDLDENFPITTQPNVEGLDWCIDKDLAFKRRLKTRLDVLGGKDEKQAIRQKMKYLIADTALERYTWRGTAEKKAFNKLTYLNDLIFKSVRTQYRNYTVKQFKTYMVEWVKHAKTRQRKVIYQYPDCEKQWENDENGDEDGYEEFDPKY